MTIRFHARAALGAAALFLSLLSVPGPVSAASSVSGGAIAEFQSTGPRSGQWMYTLQLNWTSDVPTWQITLDLGLSACPCVCAGVFDFDFPAGSGAGNGGACTTLFNGKFACSGDPFVGLSTPAIDWWPLSSACRPHGSGAGNLVFFSDLRPRTITSLPADNLFVRSGTTVWSGRITGQLPSCVGCTQTSVEENTWGRIKSVYR